jgi:hypothetical protein
MHFQFDCTPTVTPTSTEPATPSPTEMVDVLRQMLDVQREQLAYLRASYAAHDSSARWKAYLSRWQEDFPGLGDACKHVVPILERTYGQLVTELAQHLRENGGDTLDNDFTLQEFLDRYGMRLAQLGTILNLVGPLAEAGSQGESA